MSVSLENAIESVKLTLYGWENSQVIENFMVNRKGQEHFFISLTEKAL